MTKTIKNLFQYTFVLVCATLVFSCGDDELQLPDNLVQFESTALGISATEDEIQINLFLSRSATEESTIVIDAVLTGLVHGVDVVTEPALTGNTLTLTLAPGAAQASFKVKKLPGILLLGEEKIVFTIQSAGGTLVVGTQKELSVSFAEIVSSGASMSPNVGGNAQPNKVFIDFSNNRQTFISRSDWDLGFYTAEGQYRVVLNSSTGMMARLLDKTDLNAVTAADTAGFGSQLSLPAVFAALLGPPVPWISQAVNWIDDPAGDLTKTAIGEVSASVSENEVYIINRGFDADGTPRGWKKIRVLRNGGGYSLQHADINATSFSTIQVDRDDDFLFNYINFDGGLLQAEPEKERWDIAFTVFTNITAFGPTLIVPFEFRDFVVQNRHEVETAQVLTSVVSYENFSTSNLSSVVFSTTQNNIGGTWRTIPSNSPTPPSVNTDRFYVVKDAAGNIYKLRFTALTLNGERGHPQIEYALVQAGG